MNYLGIEKSSISNGPGVRVVLWVAGCSIHCKGCQNPESWNFNAGKLFDGDAKQKLFEVLSKSYIQGITFSGGHPLEPENIHGIRILIEEIKDKFPDKDIWLYTGYNLDYISPCFQVMPPQTYTLEQAKLMCDVFDVFSLCDVVVDGPYIEEQRDITLKFRGSKNQRIIDVKETLKQGRIITIQN